MKSKKDCIDEIPAVIVKATDAFWEVIAKHYGEDIKTGDISPLHASKFDFECVESVNKWINDNYVAKICTNRLKGIK